MRDIALIRDVMIPIFTTLIGVSVAFQIELIREEMQNREVVRSVLKSLVDECAVVQSAPHSDAFNDGIYPLNTLGLAPILITQQVNIVSKTNPTLILDLIKLNSRMQESVVTYSNAANDYKRISFTPTDAWLEGPMIIPQNENEAKAYADSISKETARKKGEQMAYYKQIASQARESYKLASDSYCKYVRSVLEKVPNRNLLRDVFNWITGRGVVGASS